MADITTIVSVPATADLADRLPEPAADRLVALRDARDAAYAALRAEQGRVDDARNEHARAALHLGQFEEAYRRGRLSRSTDRPDGGTTIEPDHDRIDRERRKVARLKAEHDRRRQLQKDLSERWNALARLTDRTEKYIARLPPRAVLTLDDGGRTTPPKGSIVEAVERARGHRRALLEEAADIRAAPRPRAEIVDDLAAQIDAVAAQGQPDIRALIESGHEPHWPTTSTNCLTANADGTTGAGMVSFTDTLALMCWLCRDQMVERMTALVAEQHDDELSLSTDERRDRLADLDRRLLEVERTEAGLLDMAAEQGAPMLPREDMDIRALLNLSSDLPKPKE